MTYLLTFSIPFLLVIGLAIIGYYYKFLNGVNKLLVAYLVMSLGIDLFSRILLKLYGNNLILIYLLSIAELILFSTLYQKFLKKNNIVLIITILGIAYIIYEFTKVKIYQTETFQPYAKTTSSFLIVIMTLVFFIKNIKNDVTVSKEYLYLNYGILIFFSLELLFLLPFNFLINTSSQVKFYILSVRLGINFLFYSYLIYFIWKHGKIQKQLLGGL